MSAFNAFATHLWRGAHGYDRMKVFSCTNFEGHYPVGAAAIVVAANQDAADVALRQELLKAGLPQSDTLLSFVEISTAVPSVHLLHDGNY